jgi:hypothetical protein
LWEQYHSGNITREKLQSESNKLSTQIEAHENNIIALEADMKKLEADSGYENPVIERFSNLINIQSLTIELVNELVKEIRVYAPDHIEITLNCADEFEIIKTQMGG